MTNSIRGRLNLGGPGGGGGTPGSAWVYIDIGCGHIYLPALVSGQVVLVWATAEPTLSGSCAYYLSDITPTLFAIDISGPGDLSIYSSDAGRMVAMVFQPGEAVFTTCG